MPMPLPGTVSPFSGSIAPETGTLVHLPGYTEPPRGALYIERAYQTSQPALGGVTLQVLPADGNPDITVPPGWEFRLESIGFDWVTSSSLTFGSYTILMNGNPLYGFVNNPVAVGTLNNPARVFLHVAGPAVLTILFTNNLPSTVQGVGINARVTGWLFNTAGA